MFITDALALTIVPRWTIVRTARLQSVAEHSFAVAIIAEQILRLNEHLTVHEPGLTPLCRRERVLWHALTHDVDESVTGDIPRHAKKLVLRPKREIPVLVAIPGEPLTLAELRVVKLADMMEAYTFIAMNGVGRHAESVAQRLKYDVHEYIRNEMKNLIINPGPTAGLIVLIEREYGREEATGSREGQGT